MNRSHRRPGRLCFEPLESRENPNGTVIASASGSGVLTLLGDVNDNSVRLSSSAGATVVTGLNGTQVSFGGNVSTSAVITGVSSISARLGAGNDSVSLDSSLPFSLAGNASFDLGAGDNTVSLNTSGVLSIGGNLRVNAGAGHDTVTVQGGSTSSIGGSASLSLGSGGSSVSLQDVSVAGRGGLAVSAGAGDDSLTLNAVDVTAGGVSVFGGAGTLDLTVSGSTSVHGGLRATASGNVNANLIGTVGERRHHGREGRRPALAVVRGDGHTRRGRVPTRRREELDGQRVGRHDGQFPHDRQQ